MLKAGDSSASTERHSTQPRDQPVSDLPLREDVCEVRSINQERDLNRDILASLNRLNENFQTLTQQFEPVEYEMDEHVDLPDNPNNVNI